MNTQTIFISDLHLSADVPQLNALFFQSLQAWRGKIDALYILGDFFDVWVGDDDESPFIQSIKAALADEDSRYHSVVTFFMEFHRDDVGPDIAAELFPGTDPSKLSFAEMVDFLKLKRFGSLVDDEMNQQVFIMDLSFNPEITDELMVIYFDLNQEIFCITNES